MTAEGLAMKQSAARGHRPPLQPEETATYPLMNIPSATPQPLVGIIMGSSSDWPTLRAAAEVLERLGIAFETRVVSAHRTPRLLFEYASGAEARGLRCIIAGAGGAAHLPGMAAALTALPVLGVPILSRALHGLDSLLSIVQMPAGVPVGAFQIGPAGAADAAHFAAALLRIARS
jgi:5-(carboxyamino)imidazole ribonucleotide mutase